jgi:CRP-like cAMP-binding protein
VILKGSCDIRVKLPADAGGGEVVAVTYHDGQQFGERALDYDEPRAATVQAALDSYLITFSTYAYKKILKNIEFDGESVKGGNTKTRIAQIMSKNRNLRTRDELAMVVSHVCPRVQYLQKFTYDQQIELFRVCDFCTLWGKTTLFKQGSSGQAFYIVVSGHVNVFVRKTDPAGVVVDMEVAVIHSGNSFGEKALENEAGARTATCVTNDTMTELLVIGREDYQKLIVMVQQKDFAEKVTLLRRTHPFQPMELDSLAAIGQLMEFRSWRVNSIIYVAGEASSNFFILNTGEFGIKSEVFMSDGSSQILDFGRVGPAAVLGEYCFQCEFFNDEVSSWVYMYVCMYVNMCICV